MTFGENLRRYRIQQNIKQQDLASRVGYSTAQICHIEQNKRRVDPNVVLRLFIPALGINPFSELAQYFVALAEASYWQTDRANYTHKNKSLRK
jgi:transcriptional regulator with XRE-family HTH domain